MIRSEQSLVRFARVARLAPDMAAYGPEDHSPEYEIRSKMLDRILRKKKKIAPSPLALTPISPIVNPLWFAPPAAPWRLDAPVTPAGMDA